MIQLPPDFRDLLQEFDAEGVRYLLVGGYAVMFHGYPRATKDIDLWIESSTANIQATKHALATFGAPVALLRTVSFLDPNEIFYLGVEPLRIDLFTAIPGVDFATCYPQRLTTSIQGVQVTIIDLDSLKRNKQASARPRDLDDLLHLP